jgi:hypothetical protein
MTKKTTKPQKWAVVDQDEKVIETFRMYDTAFNWVNKLKGSHFNSRLKIVRITDDKN